MASVVTEAIFIKLISYSIIFNLIPLLCEINSGAYRHCKVETPSEKYPINDALD